MKMMMMIMILLNHNKKLKKKLMRKLMKIYSEILLSKANEESQEDFKATF